MSTIKGNDFLSAQSCDATLSNFKRNVDTYYFYIYNDVK